MWISPTYKQADFEFPLSIDDKIRLFEDRTIGWKLNIADQIINGKRHPDGNEEKPPIPNSGYAVLDIVVSYFEMIAKYEDGFDRKGKSEYYFKEGVYSVFPLMRQDRASRNVIGVTGVVKTLSDFVLEVLYEGVRCGLYHSGMTNGPVRLSGGSEFPMAIDFDDMCLVINPHILITKIKEHFAGFITRLRDENNTDLRNNFEARFRFDTEI